MTEPTETSGDMTYLADKVGVIGVGDIPKTDNEEYTAVSISSLKQALDILDTLGYQDVDVCLSPSSNEMADLPFLVFRPTPKSLMADDNAAVGVAPKTEKGRSGESTDGHEVNL